MGHSALVAQGIVLKASGNQTDRPPLQPPVVGHYLGAWRSVVILNRKDMARGWSAGPRSPSDVSDEGLAPSWTSSVCSMDNNMSATGGRFHPRNLGQLIRLCLVCRFIPVFTPERQPAANARDERYNGLWHEDVWQRYRFRTLRHLWARLYAFQMASNTYLTRRLIHQGQHGRLNGARCPCPSVCPPAGTLSRTDPGDREHR